MNKLRLRIDECMSGLTRAGDSGLSAKFVFPAEFPGFDGHFPGHPVLPGVCMVQACLVVAACWTDTAVPELRSLVNAKWFVPTGPGDELLFDLLRAREGEGGTTVRARITREGERVADLTLSVGLAERQEEPLA